MYRKTSNLFFRDKVPQVYKNNKIDIAFIDGLHTYEQSLSDARNCLRYLNHDGYIIFHDCKSVNNESGSSTNSPRSNQLEWRCMENDSPFKEI